MKKISLYTIVFQLLCLFSSCESELEVKNIGDISPRLVLNTLLYAENDTCHLYITETRSVFRQVWEKKDDHWWYYFSHNFDHIKDAEVHLAINDRSDLLPYHASDSSFLLLEKLRAGDVVDIEVSHEGRNLKGTAIIPDAPEVLRVDTMTFYKAENGYTREYLQFSIKIKDTSTNRKFYRLYFTKGYTYNYSGDENPYWYYDHHIYTEDPILTQGYPSEEAEIEIGAYTRNDLAIFTNDLFAGDTYTLTFYTDTYFSWFWENEGYIRVAIQSITEDLYYYYTSIQKAYGNDETTCEPVVIYTNIKDGLGIVGAINEKVVFYEEYKDQDGIKGTVSPKNIH